MWHDACISGKYILPQNEAPEHSNFISTSWNQFSGNPILNFIHQKIGCISRVLENWVYQKIGFRYIPTSEWWSREEITLIWSCVGTLPGFVRRSPTYPQKSLVSVQKSHESLQENRVRGHTGSVIPLAFYIKEPYISIKEPCVSSLWEPPSHCLSTWGVVNCRMIIPQISAYHDNTEGNHLNRRMILQTQTETNKWVRPSFDSRMGKKMGWKMGRKTGSTVVWPKNGFCTSAPHVSAPTGHRRQCWQQRLKGPAPTK